MRSRCLVFLLGCASALMLRAAAPAAAVPSAAISHRPATPQAHIGRGIAWEPSLVGAQAKARRMGRPLLLLHLFGKLSEPFC